MAKPETIKPPTERLSEYFLGHIRQRMGAGDKNDKSCDDKVNRLTNNELFEEWLNWEGILGYDRTLRNLVEQIYGVELK